MKNDLVNHPSHYNESSGLECITFIRQFDDPNAANAFKYLWRLGKKDGNPIEQDVSKARWYIADTLAHNRTSNFPWHELAIDWLVGRLTQRHKKIFRVDDLYRLNVQTDKWILLAMGHLCRSQKQRVDVRMSVMQAVDIALQNYQESQ